MSEMMETGPSGEVAEGDVAAFDEFDLLADEPEVQTFELGQIISKTADMDALPDLTDGWEWRCIKQATRRRPDSRWRVVPKNETD